MYSEGSFFVFCKLRKIKFFSEAVLDHWIASLQSNQVGFVYPMHSLPQNT